MADTNFYFGKLEFSQLLRLKDYEGGEKGDKEELIRERLYEYFTESDTVYRETDGKWRFGNCEIWSGYIVGKFGKIFTEEHTKWDDDQDDYVTEEEVLEVADVSHFIIDPNIPGLAFNRKLHTGSSKFATAFASGYNAHFDIDDELEIKLLRTGGDRHYQDILQSANYVRSVEFDLEPPGDSWDDEVKGMDHHMRQMNAGEMKFEVKNESGLDTQEDLIRSSFELSADGYGDYKMSYLNNGVAETYDSRGSYVTEEKQDPSELVDITEMAERYGQELINTLGRQIEENQI